MLLYKYGFLLNKMKYFNNKKYQEINIFPKNCSFSESCLSKNAHALEALSISAIYYLRKNLKNAQNHHVSIKNACFLYEKTQIRVRYTKNRPNLGLFYLLDFL